MGLSIFCKEKEYSLQYSNWNDFRFKIMKATIEYVKSRKLENDDDEWWYKNLMQKFIETENHSIDFDWEYNNFFIHYDIAGLFALSKKSDCTGYYSVGNSYDICELFSKIKPFMEHDEENPNRFIAIYEIFKESVSAKTKVTIC